MPKDKELLDEDMEDETVSIIKKRLGDFSKYSLKFKLHL